MTPAQDKFKADLMDFRRQVQNGPSFAGKAQALRALRRVAELAALNK